jgi:hypothetical protein
LNKIKATTDVTQEENPNRKAEQVLWYLWRFEVVPLTWHQRHTGSLKLTCSTTKNKQLNNSNSSSSETFFRNIYINNNNNNNNITTTTTTTTTTITTTTTKKNK